MTLDVEIRKRDSGDVVIALMTIDHVDLSVPIRVANNGEHIESRGETYYGWPWRMKLPDQGEDADYQAEIVVDNIDPEIVKALKGSLIAPVVTIELVMESDPDSVEKAIEGFEMTESAYDPVTVTGRLSLPDYRIEPACHKRFIPTVFPMLVY